MGDRVDVGVGDRVDVWVTEGVGVGKDCFNSICTECQLSVPPIADVIE